MAIIYSLHNDLQLYLLLMPSSRQDPAYLEMVARFRALREHRDLSQQDLATRLGKPQTYISKIETCERRIDLIEALRLCEVLEVTLEAVIPSHLHHLLK
jgi:ribosome-binding protein aMBF1 (putative translation factor)